MRYRRLRGRRLIGFQRFSKNNTNLMLKLIRAMRLDTHNQSQRYQCLDFHSGLRSVRGSWSFWSLLEPVGGSWSLCGPSWRHLGGLLEPLGALLGASGSRLQALREPSGGPHEPQKSPKDLRKSSKMVPKSTEKAKMPSDIVYGRPPK